MRDRVLAALTALLADDAPLPAFLPGLQSVVVLTTRRHGRSLERVWSGDTSVPGAIRGALDQLDPTKLPDTIELNLAHSLKLAAADGKSTLLDNLHSGIRGVALLGGDRIEALLAPTELISTNRSMQRAAEFLRENAGIAPDAVSLGLFRFATFAAEQYLLHLHEADIEILPIFRGARPVDLSPIGEAGVRQLAGGMSSWMLNQVQPDGRTVYKYWPSRGSEAEGDNTIRQAMATICLGRIAQRSADPASRATADRNLDHLVATYFREDGPYGLMIEGEKVKLGAVSLGALAILESPQRDRYATQLEKLVATSNHLHQPDGSFRTFYAPAERDDGQYFYPGETLLFWASALHAKLPGVTAETFMRAFRYYRGFFRAQPNPAFVPWHTQAYFLARDLIADPELDSFIFEMNDWLLSMQQWDSAPYADLLGRFYDPRRPEFGKPHASATGVYLEGLIEAFELARLKGDTQRLAAYRQAILRGAQNLARLQFRTDEDMFYISQRRRVEGGIRTETYNNEIRVDNVQHGLMGLHRVLDRFTSADYAAG